MENGEEDPTLMLLMTKFMNIWKLTSHTYTDIYTHGCEQFCQMVSRIAGSPSPTRLSRLQEIAINQGDGESYHVTIS